MDNLLSKYKHITEHHPLVLTIVISLFFLFILFVVIFAMQIPTLTEDKSYSIFCNILIINLAVIGILVALASIAAMQFLENRLEKQTISNFEKCYKPTEARILTSLSYVLYQIYGATSNHDDLEKAIELAQKAHNVAKELDRLVLDNVKVLTQTINNLGYYLAERGDIKDRLIAHKYADFLTEKCADFPEDGRQDWSDTVAFIYEKFPKG